MMISLPLPLLLCGLIAGTAGANDGADEAPKRPNIVLILADDLGVECVGAYGGQSYRTPHIDALAAEGMRFTRCFANPYCSPSRAQLLTGRYPMHNGIRRVIYDPEQHCEFLDPAAETGFATLLRQAGYATAIAGKWQLSFLHERDTVAAFGFDESMMWQIFLDGEKTSRYADPTLRHDGRVLHDELRGRYGPDVQLEFLIDFIGRHRDRPFCAYYAALLPHYPWEPTPAGDEPLRPAEGEGDRRYMGDMVAYLDAQVGRLVAALERLGLREETLILFTADNGTDRRITSAWSDGQATRLVPGGKGTLTDAGTRVPLIASWPGVTEPGSTRDDLIDLSDLLPTLVEVAGAPASPNPINGRSFAPRLRGEPGAPRSWIHVMDKDRRHVRDGNFILTDRGEFRPVVGIGEEPAEPLSGPLTAEQAAARRALEAALRQAEHPEGAPPAP